MNVPILDPVNKNDGQILNLEFEADYLIFGKIKESFIGLSAYHHQSSCK